MTKISHCGSCNTPVYWLKNGLTGKIAPIETEPNERGNVVISLDHGTYTVLGPTLRRMVLDGQMPSIPPDALYLNHFVTCPQAKTWTKGGRQ